MWRDFRITAGRDSPVLCGAPNLFFFFSCGRASHCKKNFRNHLCRGQQIRRPPDIVAKLELLCDILGLWPVKQLLAHEKGKELKMALNLLDTHISPGHFQKMKVSYAVQLMSHSTACALQELVRQRLPSPITNTKPRTKSWRRRPIALTTAWLLKQVN